MIRVAAVGDIHVGAEGAGRLAEPLGCVPENADVLLLAGDLTRCGDPSEARALAAVLGEVTIPVVAVLGNHDHHAGEVAQVVAELERGGVWVLEGQTATFCVGDELVGVAGCKGFGGGFVDACVSEFGEEEVQSFARHAREAAERLGTALDALPARAARIALTHYSPVRDTLRGEPPEIFPFLGSYLLAEAIDGAGASLAIHGHAHRGREQGTTAGGVPVRNVAEAVIDAPFRVYGVHQPTLTAG